MKLPHPHPRRMLLAAAAALAIVPAAASATPVTPRDAGTFADSIGVNTHLTYTRTAYGNTAAVRAALQYLGVKHVRDVLAAADGGATGADQYNNLLKFLHDNDGVRYLLTEPPPKAGVASPAALVATAATTLRGDVDGLEPPNEYDLSGFTDWATRLRTIQGDLLSAVRARPELAGIPVLAPAMGHTSSWAAGDLSALADRANSHPYPGSHRPGDWTNLKPSQQLATYVAGPKPLWAGELGYHNATKDTTTFEPVSERAAGVYLPQLLLVGDVFGLQRQYVYQLLDDTADTSLTQRDHHFGLFRNDFTPKPAALSLARLLRLTAGTPGAAPGTPLDYTVSATPDVVSLLSQRADGTWLIALWRNLPIWNPTTRQDVTVATTSTTVRFARTVDVRVQRLGTQTAPSTLASNTTSVTLPVGADDTTFLLVRPAGT